MQPKQPHTQPPACHLYHTHTHTHTYQTTHTYTTRETPHQHTSLAIFGDAASGQGRRGHGLECRALAQLALRDGRQRGHERG